MKPGLVARGCRGHRTEPQPGPEVEEVGHQGKSTNWARAEGDVDEFGNQSHQLRATEEEWGLWSHWTWNLERVGSDDRAQGLSLKRIVQKHQLQAAFVGDGLPTSRAKNRGRGVQQ